MSKHKVVVIGGGALGMQVSVFAARAGFEVVLFDKGEIGGGAVVAAAQSHSTGLEYGASLNTGKECSMAHYVHALMWHGVDAYANIPGIIFAVPESTDAKGYFSFREYSGAYCDQIQDYHQFLYNKVQEKAPLTSGLFASPDKEKLFGVLQPEELKALSRHFQPMAGAIQSTEIRFDIPRRNAHMMLALQHNNVQERPHSKVVGVAKNGNAFTIHLENGKTETADMVVDCSWEGQYAIDRPWAAEKPQMPEVEQRAMLLLDTRNVNPYIPSIFSIDPKPTLDIQSRGDISAFMFSRLSSHAALFYLAANRPGAYWGGIDPKNPQWNSDYTQKDLMDYFERAKWAVPGLENAKPVSLIVRPTVRQAKDLREQRPYPPVQEMEKSGYWLARADKYVFADRLAVEIVLRLMERREHGPGKDIGTPEPLDKILDDLKEGRPFFSMTEALEGRWSLKEEDMVNREIAYVASRGLSPFMLNDNAFKQWQEMGFSVESPRKGNSLAQLRQHVGNIVNNWFRH